MTSINKYYLKIHITSFCLFLSIILVAQNGNIILSELPDTSFNIRPHLQIYADETTNITWEEAYALKEDGNFAPFESYQFKPQLERGKYDYWFYFAIDFESEQAERILFRRFGSGSLFFYHLKDGQLMYHRKGGNLHYNDDSNANYAYLKNDFPCTLYPGKNEFLVFKRPRPSYYPNKTQPYLLKEAFANPKEDKYLLLFFATNGFFLGALAFVILFSIVQYFQIGERAFLFYALYVLSLFFYFLRYFSLSSQYFYFLPPWTMSYLQHNVFNYPMFITYVIFLRVFLDTKKNFPLLEQIIRIKLALIFGYFILHRVMMLQVNLNWAYQMDKYVRFMFLGLGIAVLIVLFKNQNKLVKYILAGFFSLLLFTLLGQILTYNDNHHWLWWEKANTLAQIGVLAELLCFSMGLGYKIQLIEVEKNKVKNELQLKKQEAQQSHELDQFKTRFYNNITHELRTPLTVIGGLTNQIQERPNYKLKERLGYIKSNTNNLLDLINQLLDLSKLEAGHIALNYKQQDIIPYLRFLTESFQSVAFDKKIMLSFYSTEEVLWIDFDSEKIKRILINLLSNALKFTPKYGKILVEIKCLNQTDLTVIMNTIQNKNRNDNYLEFNNLDVERATFLSLKIKDTGKGINAKNLPHIFDRFYQANSDNQFQEGTGLGLAMVKELVLLMQGAILVKSTLNEGTSITIILPVVQQSERIDMTLKENNTVIKKTMPVQSSLQKESIPLSNQARILIVEDSKDVIYYLKACLEEKYQLWTARDGEEGWEKATQSLPDLIISDVMMPKMNGFDLCQQLKKDRRTAHIPIILLTARTQKADVHKGLTYGADAYLTKPFNQEELYLRIENLLSIREKVKAQILEVQPAKVASEADAKFLEKLRSIILENLHQDDFNTQHLCRALATSRSQLHRKLKALTGFSTADYIRHIRLQKAKILLVTTQLSIGEISLQVGFKTQAHFSRAFLKEFGKNPSGTRK